ncbi:hypothetical protein BJ878DRAFT_124597 [Calycina marina]|uniref:DUF6604 domain-containing protein n=1 Tax=Calycina marina TaxID=1763456 RepID=A0A9P7Z1D9_9HELO|nr:hypothetical protein BJ878DRAFT_124597 [Calycina marina]
MQAISSSLSPLKTYYAPLAPVENLSSHRRLGAPKTPRQDPEHILTDPSPTSLPPSLVIYEEEPRADKTVWLIYCFFEDFNVVREHPKDLWMTYQVGEIRLIAVALATNTAFERFHRASVELRSLAQRFGKDSQQCPQTSNRCISFCIDLHLNSVESTQMTEDDLAIRTTITSVILLTGLVYPSTLSSNHFRWWSILQVFRCVSLVTFKGTI